MANSAQWKVINLFEIHHNISGKAIITDISELIRSIVADGKYCSLTSRYCDFYSLISRIEKAQYWKDFSLQDLFQAIDALVRHIANTNKMMT